MTSARSIVCLFALAVLLLTPAVFADEALPELKGTWIVETSKGEPPPEGVTMTMTFVDDKTLRIEASFEDKQEKKEVKYEATADGKLTLYPDPEADPDGEKATWAIKENKLHLTNEDKEELVLVRQS